MPAPVRLVGAFLSKTSGVGYSTFSHRGVPDLKDLLLVVCEVSWADQKVRRSIRGILGLLDSRKNMGSPASNRFADASQRCQYRFPESALCLLWETSGASIVLRLWVCRRHWHQETRKFHQPRLTATVRPALALCVFAKSLSRSLLSDSRSQLLSSFLIAPSLLWNLRFRIQLNITTVFDQLIRRARRIERSSLTVERKA